MKKLLKERFKNGAVSCSLAIPLSNLISCSSPTALETTNDEGNNNDEDNNNINREISILFLGTGAYDWNQDQYPTNKNNLTSGLHRGFTSILINNSVLIDCGPTVPKAIDLLGVDVNDITDILITHSNEDHFNVKAINEIQTKRTKENNIKLWVHQGVSSFFVTLVEVISSAIITTIFDNSLRSSGLNFSFSKRDFISSFTFLYSSEYSFSCSFNNSIIFLIFIKGLLHITWVSGNCLDTSIHSANSSIVLFTAYPSHPFNPANILSMW